MTWIAHLTWLFHLSSAYPFFRAWRANRETTLTQALGWAGAAWLLWLLADLCFALGVFLAGRPVPYLALCLTGCAGVAVLGARRPGVGAWNFVVLGLLAVLLLQLAEGMDLLGASPLREFFLAATLAVGLLNYLPTRLGVGTLCLALACAVEFASLLGGASRWGMPGWVSGLCAALAPWLALGSVCLPRGRASELDRTWLEFRDRFGFVWGQRLREQFNRAASHAEWDAYLTWSGLRASPELNESERLEMLATLCALLRRFGAHEQPPSQGRSEGRSPTSSRPER